MSPLLDLAMAVRDKGAGSPVLGCGVRAVMFSKAIMGAAGGMASLCHPQPRTEFTSFTSPFMESFGSFQPSH